MKKVFSSLLFAVIVMTGLAQVKQDTSQHLAFKGVPIDGTLDDYVSKMKQNGFTHTGTAENGTAILKGDFAGYQDCTIGVSTLKQKNLVYRIAVMFTDKDTWSALSGNYFDLKQMLTEKYGKPFNVVEKFDGYSQPTDDGSKMIQVQLDRCKYYSIWETDKGNIQLTITHDGATRCYIFLGYSDKINGDKIKSSAKDDL